MKRKIIFTVIFILIFDLLCAETIVLENGTRIKGSIEKETGENVVIVDENSIKRIIPKIKIVEIIMDNIENNSTQEYNPETQSTNMHKQDYNRKDKKGESSKYTSLNFGYGNSYGGLGANLLFKGKNAAFHLGAGYFQPAISWVDPAILFSGGFKIYLSKSMYLDAQFGSFGIQAEDFSDFGLGKKQEILYGPSLLFGGDWLFSEHFGFNAAIGASYNLVESYWFDLKILVALDLGIMLKF